METSKMLTDLLARVLDEKADELATRYSVDTPKDIEEAILLLQKVSSALSK